MAMTEQQQLQAELQQLQSQISAQNAGAGGGLQTVDAYRSRSSATQGLTNRAMAIQNQLAGMQQQDQQKSLADQGTKSKADAQAAKDEMMKLSQNGIDRLGNDSTDKMIREYLQKQQSGQPLDPNGKPFAKGAPNYDAAMGKSQGYNATDAKSQGYNAANGSASSWNAAQMGDAPMVGGGGPWDATSRGAYMTDATDRAAAGESTRNQMIRDAILQSGGNASDPALAASMAESMSQRNAATAQAGNQLNMRATSDNFNAQRQADLANQGAKMAQGQYNASNQQQANSSNAGMRQQMDLANMSSQNQAAQFGAGSANQAEMANAGAHNQASQYGAEAANRQAMTNQSAQNQAGMFNTGNQMQAQQQNFNAGTQAAMYNNQNQNQANSQLAGYNNQRQQMLSGAENSRIGLLGQQRFTTAQPQQQQQMSMPSFAQFQQQQQRPQQQAQSYSQPRQAPAQLTGSVWAGSGRPSVGSGFTTSTFGPTQVGNPFGPGAQVGTSSPALHGDSFEPGAQYGNVSTAAPNGFAPRKNPGVKISQPVSDPVRY